MKIRFQGHTSGPLCEPYHQKWDEGPDRVVVADAKGNEVAAFTLQGENQDAAWANARLFVRTTDLLAALVELVEAVEGPGCTKWAQLGTGEVAAALAAAHKVLGT